MSANVGCPACGRPLEPSAAFCATCGTAVASWAPQVAPPAQPATTSDGPHPALIAGFVIAVVLAVGAVAAVVLLVAGGDGGEQQQAAAATPPPTAEVRTIVEQRPAPAASKQYDRGAYELSLPSAWLVQARGEDKGSYIESVWRHPSDADVTVLVDHTPGYTDPPEVGAQAVRSMTSQSDGYREIAFGPTRLGGRDAWRWEFEAGGERKVDYFLTACGTGFAILGTAPPARFARHADDFRRAAQSLDPTC